MTASPAWRPLQCGERYPSIDVVRGLALLGVLLVNLLTAFRIPLLEHISRPHSGPGGIDRVIDILVAGVLEFKALTIFSFLFGAGIAIQFERAERRDVSPRRFLLRRMAWLFVIGTAHLFLLWNGDILALYAVCGLLLLPFAGMPWPKLCAIGALAIALPEAVPFGLPLPSEGAAEALIAQAHHVYAEGGYLGILKFRWQETWSLIVPLLAAILPRTLGLMCWGMAVWRGGILREAGRYRRTLAAAIAFGAVAGAAITTNAVWAAASGDVVWPVPRFADSGGPLLLAMAYVSGALLFLNPRRVAALPGLAAAGRMALTNYLLQSTVLGFVFYGYGFGLFGRLGPASALCIGLALYTVQVQLSKRWLDRFQFGPIEWLWRWLTYGQRPPLRRFASPARTRGGGSSLSCI